MRRASLGLVLALILVHVSCTGSTKSSGTATPPPQVTVSVTPTAANVRAGAGQPFSAAVTGTTNQSVIWSVNGIVGGNATVGLISNTGLYTAPGTLPNQNTITIGAASVANSGASGTSDVTLWNATPVLSNVSPTTFTAGAYYADCDRQPIREWRAGAVRRRGGDDKLCFDDEAHSDGIGCVRRNFCRQRVEPKPR